MILDTLEHPIVLAPLAGGPSTVELAVAVSEAGGLGFLAAGYQTAPQVAGQIAAFRDASPRPFGVNVFAPPSGPADAAVVAARAAQLQGEAEAHGVALGEPRFDDDDWAAKLDVLAEARVPVVAFVFGCPPRDAIGRLQSAGTSVWATVTTRAEAAEAVAAGVDAVVAQGSEAGGHRGAFTADAEQVGLLALLQLIHAEVGVPIVAAGGIATGAAVAAVLAAGAAAAQIGTAFLRCPEAGTAPVHRTLVAGDGPTAITRAFTGKPARGIVNRFMREFGGEDAPAAYPEIHHLTVPLRRAGRAAGDGDVINLWAGQAHALAREEPAAAVVARLAADARAAVRRSSARLQGSA